MNEVDLILTNLREIRRRSIILWKGLPPEHHHWKPDDSAMTAIELVRHVLGADHGWHRIIRQQDMSDYRSPWTGRPYLDVEGELALARPHREAFLQTIGQFTPHDLHTLEIIHPGNGRLNKLGAYLLRIGYHESVHAGQFLTYLRGMGVQRPFIWD